MLECWSPDKVDRMESLLSPKETSPELSLHLSLEKPGLQRSPRPTAAANSKRKALFLGMVVAAHKLNVEAEAGGSQIWGTVWTS